MISQKVASAGKTAPLLDGEMIVDEDKKSGKQQRRYLVYDMIMLEGEVLIRRPFKVMFTLFLLKRPLKQSWWAKAKGG